MVRYAVRIAAGLIAWAALTGTASAEDAPIEFVSGPFAGAVGQDTVHKENQLDYGYETENRARFAAGPYVGEVQWLKLSGNYYRRDPNAIGRLTRMVEHVFGVGGSRTVDGDQKSVNGFLAQYRRIEIGIGTSTPKNCAVYYMTRQPDSIYGYVCGPAGQPVPLDATMNGLSIRNVIGP